MTATPPVPGTETTIDELRDRLEIMELTSQLVLSVDARDWSAAERLFTDVVDVDYTSLLGGEPQSVRAAELIGGWRQALGRLEATQHLVGNHVITVAGDEATCAANVQATHVLPNATGGPVWTVGGRYDFRLARVSSGWRISAMTFVLKWATGNQHVMELAAAAASSGSPAR